MKILLTGAFGRLGSQVAEQALAMGHTLRCFDIGSKATRKVSRQFESRCEIYFGDLTATRDFSEILSGIDAVIHLAAMLPPDTELRPELAERVNVDATRRLIGAIAKSPQPAHLIYTSSVSVFARTDNRARPRQVSDPTEATDNYTRHKLAIEEVLQASDIPWTILRIAVAVDARDLSADRSTFRKLLDAAHDTPVEWVHPKDVALAMCRCVEVQESRGRSLLIGGGKSCQVSHARFMGTSFRAMGLTYPAQVHGSGYFYMHWMDTRESEALLQYQRHDFADYEREITERLKHVSRLVYPLRGLLNSALPRILGKV